MHNEPQKSVEKKSVSLPTSASEVEVRIKPPTVDNKPVSTPPASLRAQATVDTPLEAFAKTVTQVGEVISNTATRTGQAFVETAAGMGGIVGNTAVQTGKAVVETATGIGGAVGSTAAHTGKAIVDVAVGVGGAFGNTAFQTSKAVVDTASGVGEAVAKQTYNLINQATQGAGQTVDSVSDNWLVRRLAGAFKLDWLVGATSSVDLKKAEEAVRKLKQKHPNETPSQIAHRLMVEKATYAGGIGLVTSFLPGAAAALLAVDLVATTQLQAEMVYQIAAAYGLDLQDPARKGEVLAIFGLALGGGRAFKAGSALLRNVPFAGAVIGASTNATILYALGYAACRFYEAKLDSSTSLTSEKTLVELEQQSEKYLEVAIAQEALMDQILVHMIVASHPQQSWEKILPQIQALKLSPSSLEVIAANIKSPQPLDQLLNQLNRDFSVPLLAQCYRIARLNGNTSPEEARVMEAIATKFEIDLNSIASAIPSEASK